MPYAYLAYCRDLEDFFRFAAPLGRFLARRGFPLVIIDSNGPIRGLIGRYSPGSQNISRGRINRVWETWHTRNWSCSAFASNLSGTY